MKAIITFIALSAASSVVSAHEATKLPSQLDGTQCDAHGYTPCVAASVWDSEANTWRSASAHWEE